VFGLAVVLFSGLVSGILSGLDSPDMSKAAHPKDLWRADLIWCVAVGLVIGLVYGIAVAVMSGFVNGPIVGFGLAVALIVAPAAGLMVSAAWRVAVSQIYLTMCYRMPVRLGRFLADAHARNLMRTVGPIYQFRHATLQDRLAPPDPVST
jgi:hypothetical protein